MMIEIPDKCESLEIFATVGVNSGDNPLFEN